MILFQLLLVCHLPLCQAISLHLQTSCAMLVCTCPVTFRVSDCMPQLVSQVDPRLHAAEAALAKQSICAIYILCGKAL